MCGSGFSVTCPPWNAVESPPSFAISECAPSWHVVEKRKTMYHITPSIKKSGVSSPGPAIHHPATDDADQCNTLANVNDEANPHGLKFVRLEREKSGMPPIRLKPARHPRKRLRRFLRWSSSGSF